MRSAPASRTNYQAAPYGQPDILVGPRPDTTEPRKLHELLQERDYTYNSDTNPLPRLRRWTRIWQDRWK